MVESGKIMRYIIAIYVENKHGVLTRVSSLFMRRGFNISSLTVSETENTMYSRITITLDGDDYSCDQLIKQLYKLQNVKKVKRLDQDGSVERELALIKVYNTPETRNEITSAVDVFRAKIIDYTPGSICIEVTGEPLKINAFIDVIKSAGILEICRTGIVALDRGTETLT